MDDELYIFWLLYITHVIVSESMDMISYVTYDKPMQKGLVKIRCDRIRIYPSR